VAPVRAQRQRPRPGDVGEQQRRVEVGKQVAVARNLPTQRFAEPRPIDGDEQEVVLAVEMLRRRLFNLLGADK